MKRALSFMLAFIMVLSLVPAASAAAEDLTAKVGVTGLTVTAGDTKTAQDGTLIGDNPSGTVNWSAEPGKITAVANPIDEQVGATLTFQNTLGHTAVLRFDYFLDHLADPDPDVDDWAEVWNLEGDAGTFEMELKQGDSYTITIVSPLGGYGLDPATLTISNISLSAEGEATVTFAAAENGTYTVGDSEITGETSYTVATGTKYAVSATAASGYRFFGWYDGAKYISYKAADNITISENCTISPVFIKDDVAVFGVGEARFQSLTEADTYANSSVVKTIVLMNDGILTGEHTISAGNTLLIPFDASNTVLTEATSIAYYEEKEDGSSQLINPAWEQPNPYRTLTMAAGAKLTVNGSLNVGGKHSAGPFLTAGSPSGDLGMIRMAEGSNITVANGGVLYCWGYIYGNGTVTVKQGGAAHENFQFSDFRGGNITLGLATTFLVFPISQYYVQNIEVAATFEEGAAEYVWGSIYLQSQVHGTSVKFIGDDPELCMFVPGKGGTVTKTYDPATDRLIIDVDGDGSINPMGLELGGTKINTATFVLPINSNMTINVNSGTTALNQSLALLPGVELTIAESATLSVKSREPLKNEDGTLVHYKGGNNLIVYDRDQWFNAYQPILNNNVLIGANYVEAKFVYSKSGFKRLQPVAWSPTRTGSRTEADLKDAVVDINGKLITEGFIYTTIDLDLQKYLTGQGLEITGGGAAVTSSEGTGVLVMNNGMGMDNITLQPYQNTEKVEFAYIPMITARLQNADGSYLDTIAAAPGATFSYCEKCGQWYAGTKDTHTVEITWIVDGVSEPQEICKGTKPVYGVGTDPVKSGYEFVGWSLTAGGQVLETLPLATEDAVYYAIFEEKAEGMLGDFNGDAKITADDLTLLARHIGGIEALTGQSLQNADLTGDGKVTADDLTKHARYVGGIIKDWNQE